MKKIIPSTFVFLLFITSMSCQTSNHKEKDPLDLSGRDTTVHPADNFFKYANGTWLKNTKIPASKTGWGSFYIVRDQALQNMHTLLDSCLTLKDAKKGSVGQQVG